jgi:hypothetical protein
MLERVRDWLSHRIGRRRIADVSEEFDPNGEQDKLGRDPDREPVVPHFDVAVTFAGEDRVYVDRVVTRLRDGGVRVFYDEDEQARLWGRNLLEVLVDTYRSRAFRVLMFTSAAYARKKWPTQERRATLERAMQSDEPYVLPVLLVDTPVPGLPGTTAHVDGRKRTPEEVADITIDHLRAHGRDLPAPPAQRDQAHRVNVRAIPERTPEGDWEIPFDIHNGSDYPIENVMVIIKDPGLEGDPSDQMGTAVELVIGTVAAGAHDTGHIDKDWLRFTRDPAFGELGYLATLLFTDHWGNYWAVTATKLVQKEYPARSC